MRINWLLPTLNLSGGVRCNLLFAEALARRGHDVRVVYPTVRRRRRPRYRSWSRWPSYLLGSRYQPTPAEPNHLNPQRVTPVPVNEDPIPGRAVPDADVSIATWWQTRLWLEDWPGSTGVKAYFVHGHEIHGEHPDRAAATYRLPGPAFAVSTWLQRVLAEQYDAPGATLVPNGVDRSQFDSRPRAMPNPPTVGFLYAPISLKGPDTALGAIQRLRRDWPNLRVVAYGANDPTPEHAELLGDAEFFKQPAQDRIPEIYQSATCWIVPSTSEGFGMPGLEAAACHSPIVSTRCGGPEDYIEEGVNGHLVDIGDDAALADAVGQVLALDEDRWQAMSRASYAISQRFDWDRSGEILETALERAVAGGRKGLGVRA